MQIWTWHTCTLWTTLSVHFYTKVNGLREPADACLFSKSINSSDRNHIQGDTRVLAFGWIFQDKVYTYALSLSVSVSCIYFAPLALFQSNILHPVNKLHLLMHAFFYLHLLLNKKRVEYMSMVMWTRKERKRERHTQKCFG